MKKKIINALISVSDKSNLKSILKILKKHKIKIISSGGTFKKIKKLGYNCEEVSKFTNYPEILGGRVKTLHPKIFGGILNIRNNKKHQNDMVKKKYEKIDLVIVNFYPFENTLKKTQNHTNIIENIDIGGPAMARAAAKNYNDVTIITSINQYQNLAIQLNKNKGSTNLEYRKKLSEEAFSNTSYYDSLITNYLKTNNTFPEKITFHGNLIETLRYGENPHQKAALYSIKKELGITQLHGKKLSYNNYNDIFSALNISKTLPKNLGTIIIKHTNPCGVSINKDKTKSYKEAIACDPISAFGGIVCCNFKINKKIAIEMSKIFLEIVIGVKFEKNALKILKKRKNLRIIDLSNFEFTKTKKIASNFDTFLLQDQDNKILSKKDFQVVSKRKPKDKMLSNLIFAFNICRNVKSNAIVLTNNTSTIGIGSGQSSRLDSCKIAIEKMIKFQKINNYDEIIAASDAFFPFVDGIETLVQAGISAIVQPYGSKNDKEIIKFANRTNTVLVFSKTRHFKH